VPTTVLTANDDIVVVSKPLKLVVNGAAEVPGDNLLLDGLAGVDTIDLSVDTYASWLAGFTITATAAGLLSISKGAVNVQFSNFETLKFSDITINLGTSAADIITGGSDDDAFLYGLGGNDTIDGGLGADTMYGDGGDDTYVVDNILDKVVEAAGVGAGIDLVNASVSFTLDANIENLTLTGGDINGTGNALDNVIIGSAGANRLSGGGAGADKLIGGAGNDTYVIAAVGDTITEAAGGGVDTVEASITITTLAANVENLTLTGATAIDGTGNGLDNVIVGNGGDNTLDGGAGADTLVGGAGDDIYIIDTLGDTITEAAGAAGGIDLAKSSVSIAALDANVEKLTLTGTAAIDGTGNGLDNTITGNNGNNTLDGGGGSDKLIGGAGDDIYVLNVAGDTITEAANGGIDLAKSSVTMTALDANVENLTLTGTGTINGTGNALDNIIIGNSGDNTLTSGAGNDTLDGGGGNDTLVGGADDDIYIISAAGDTITEAAAGGTDTVKASISLTLAANVEFLILTGTSAINGTGNVLANSITGNAGDNALSGGGGNDVLDGGVGSDTLVLAGLSDDYSVTAVNATQSKIVDSVSGRDGTDTISGIEFIKFSDVTLTIDSFLSGTNVITGTVGNDIGGIYKGTSANDTIYGLAGDDTLGGSAGNDVLVGGIGNDTYVINSTADVVTEKDGEGLDTVRASVNISALAVFVENLVLTGTAANGGGNGLDNIITGNASNNTLNGNGGADTLYGDGGVDTLNGGAGNDILNGGAGADQLNGGADDDVYFIDESDSVSELASQGTDEVRVQFNVTSLFANVENLALLEGGNYNATGNSGNNIITGNSSANQLNGAGGADTLIGGGGGDTYIVDTANDTIVELAGGGTDTIQSTLSQTVLSDNVENLVLTGSGVAAGYGNDLSNSIVGNSSSNSIDGGGGADDMTGGAGDDVYVVDTFYDRVNENVGGGRDVIVSTVTIFSLAANIEVLDLVGTESINGKGNDLDNKIVGNAGNNVLNGGAGADSMVGNLGNDTYYVDSADDSVREYFGYGTDKVVSSLDYALRSNFENLTLAGNAIVAKGNSLANTIVGNAQANVIIGGGGADILKGGSGRDSYVFNSIYDSKAGAEHDSILGFAHGFDKLDLSKIDANGKNAGNGTFNYIGASTFHGAASELHAVMEGNTYLVEGDVNGDGVADFQVSVQSGLKISATDFVL
jgi:Ca2+-binding RTX toxin-like protein